MPERVMSDRKATLLACGCLFAFVTIDAAVTVLLVYMVLRWLG
jgi:hypothetical protein